MHLSLVAWLLFAAAGDLPPTPGETIRHTRYTQNEDIGLFLSQLDARSDALVVQIVGRSRDTAAYGARDLFLCLLTDEGAENAAALDRSKPTLFLFASQHGNEQSAKEAALALVRDLAVGDMRSILALVNVLVMPQVNPHGNWADQRRNEQNLDLNRDHVKLEAPATEAIHRVFRTFMPEVTVDAHEKGDDYYRASYGCVSNLNIDERLQSTCRDVLLAEVAATLAAAGITFHEYLVTQPMGIESAAGAALPDSATRARETMKRYSTTDLNDGRNSLGIYQTLSVIFEGASRHDLATLDQRTGWQRAALRAFIESVARHGDEIVALVGGLRRDLLAHARVFSAEDPVHLRMRYVRAPDQPTLTLRRFVDDGSAGPTTADEVIENWFPRVLPTHSVSRPLGYVVPARHQDVVETLLRHGIRVEVFVHDDIIDVESYRIRRLIPAEYDYLAPEEIETEVIPLAFPVEKGDFYVSVAQAAAALIPALLEPSSQYGMIRYRVFDLVPAVGDRFAFLRRTRTGDLPVVPYKPW